MSMYDSHDYYALGGPGIYDHTYDRDRSAPFQRAYYRALMSSYGDHDFIPGMYSQDAMRLQISPWDNGYGMDYGGPGPNLTALQTTPWNDYRGYYGPSLDQGLNRYPDGSGWQFRHPGFN